MDDLRPYEPPHLEPLTFTAIGKHLDAVVETLEGPDTGFDPADLLARFGSPLYLVSEAALRNLYRNFTASFSDPGIETRVAYSYKTNYLPAICRILHDEGAWAEIVSGLEYSLARALDVAPGEIIFNGPWKSRDELELALAEGAIVNIDNFDELRLVEQVAAGLGRTCPVGIRISFRHGPEAWTKFGFSDDNGDSQRALERIATCPHLSLQMLHNHSGTFQLVHDIYGKATDVLIGAAKRARDLGLAPTMIDLGGGYPSANRLKPGFDLPGGSRPGTLFPYAEAVLGRLAKAVDLFGGRPVLVLEPGRAIVDSAVQLLCTVVGRKNIPGGIRAVIVDAGVNLVPTAYWYDHGVSGGRESDDPSAVGTVTVYGPLCMQIDVLRDRAILPPLEIGDPLSVANVGAYCQTQSMQFIQPRPATVLLGPDGPEVIRRSETWRDFFALDEVPERLRSRGHAL